MAKPKFFRSLKFCFILIDLVRRKNRQIREQNETIRNLRRREFYDRHGKAVAKLTERNVDHYGKAQRAGL